MLKNEGLFYLALGSLITSHNDYSVERCERGLRRMRQFLEEIPAAETEDIRLVKECMEVLEMELKQLTINSQM